MAMNAVQFQAGLSMAQFLARYGTEASVGARCIERAGLRDSAARPAVIGAAARSSARGRPTTSAVSAGADHAARRHAVRGDEAAAHDVVPGAAPADGEQDQRGRAGVEAAPGVTYRTAWRLKHKIMQAMTQREESRRLRGLVQIDDAYLGGERNGGKPRLGEQAAVPDRSGDQRESGSSGVR